MIYNSINLIHYIFWFSSFYLKHDIKNVGYYFYLKTKNNSNLIIFPVLDILFFLQYNDKINKNTDLFV